MEAKWQHPWTSVIPGATGSDKSCFVQKLVNHIDTISDTQFARIILHYSEWQNGDPQERSRAESSDQQKPIDHDIDQSIIESVPVKLHSKAKRLLRRLRAAGGISWDSTGTVSIDGACIRGASILDLVNYSMRARKQSSPPGHLQFAAILRRAGIPREYIDDYARERDIAYADKNADRRKADRVLAERAFSRILASQVDPDKRTLALMTAWCMASKITSEKLFSRITKAITGNKKKDQAKKKKEPTKTPADADGKEKKKEKK
ncbi:hypothetical protein QAD02_021643 [Eretmocerus hayati]|uniref:Uncharacterized protein n=1 Tax=Eretmocerus hayati TaxID=131215 RepID=A0ACC2PR20_9HYME|nr:hypothetical protein QAD02_021643 [Eretmocerus hayati]